jgi:hypothetical protein
MIILQMRLEELTMRIALNKIRRDNFNKNIKNNLLFLDFDGVINIPIFNFSLFTNKELEDLYNKANPDRIKNLNKLCKMFNLNIVISSSWRISGLEYCIDYLLKSGLDPSINIVGMTKLEKGYKKRFYKIYEYLIENPYFTNFIIIDDLDMFYLNSFLIKTKFEDGFDEKKLKEAIDLCNKFI